LYLVLTALHRVNVLQGSSGRLFRHSNLIGRVG
jgi:hypothetical protein